MRFVILCNISVFWNVAPCSQVEIDVSEETADSIFSVEES
jgi:hypothetical protein